MEPSQNNDNFKVPSMSTSHNSTTIELETLKDTSKENPFTFPCNLPKKSDAVQFDFGDMEPSAVPDDANEERRGNEGSKENIIPEETRIQRCIPCLSCISCLSCSCSGKCCNNVNLTLFQLTYLRNDS